MRIFSNVSRRFTAVPMLARRALILALGAVSLVVPIVGLAQGRAPIRMNDSDWWSVLGKYNSIDFSQAGVKHVAPAPSNFKILNVLLGIKQFDAVVDELGETSSIERGDAALGRTQMCYVSASHSPQVHLIFEQGSEGSVFARYLFENGPTWEGDNSCTPSNQISARMQTANGLRLGDSEAKAEAVLGKPTKASGDALIYVYEVKKKTSLTAFIRER